MTDPRQRDCQCRYARHTHGTNRAYMADHCRCFRCRVAHAAAQQAYRDGQTTAEKPPSRHVTVRRQLQALAAVGWGRFPIAGKLGLSPGRVYQLRTDNPKTPNHVSEATADAVAALYDKWWDVRPAGADADRTRTAARKQGWVPPLAWDDDTIRDPAASPSVGVAVDVDVVRVERAMRGERVRLTMLERHEAHRRLNAQGLSARQIADRLGISDRTVVRRRAA